jgi:hypothetical protein
MGSVGARLDRLEGRLGGAVCACQRGPIRILMPGDPPPGPCPGCGRAPEPLPFTIDFARVGGDARGDKKALLRLSGLHRPPRRRRHPLRAPPGDPSG